MAIHAVPGFSERKVKTAWSTQSARQRREAQPWEAAVWALLQAHRGLQARDRPSLGVVPGACLSVCGCVRVLNKTLGGYVCILFKILKSPEDKCFLIWLVIGAQRISSECLSSCLHEAYFVLTSFTDWMSPCSHCWLLSHSGVSRLMWRWGSRSVFSQWIKWRWWWC